MTLSLDPTAPTADDRRIERATEAMIARQLASANRLREELLRAAKEIAALEFPLGWPAPDYDAETTLGGLLDMAPSDRDFSPAAMRVLRDDAYLRASFT